MLYHLDEVGRNYNKKMVDGGVECDLDVTMPCMAAIVVYLRAVVSLLAVRKKEEIARTKQA